MAAAAILHIQIFIFLVKFSNLSYACVYAALFSANSSIDVEVINTLVIPRWRPPPPWIFNYAFFMKFFSFQYTLGYGVQIAAK